MPRCFLTISMKAGTSVTYATAFITVRVPITFFLLFFLVPGATPVPQVPDDVSVPEVPGTLLGTGLPGLTLRTREEGAAGLVWTLGCLVAVEADLMGVDSLSVSLAMLEAADAEDDLADRCLEAGEGGGMALVGVWKEEPAGVGPGVSSRPSNWGIFDMFESAVNEEALVDLGRDPGVAGGMGLLLIGVWKLVEVPEERAPKKSMN